MTSGLRARQIVTRARAAVGAGRPAVFPLLLLSVLGFRPGQLAVTKCSAKRRTAGLPKETIREASARHTARRRAALRRNRPDIQAEKIQRLRELMNKAVRDCLVSGYEPLIEGIKLPDPDDRHVLAAAIKVGAQVIVTRNLRDFPAADLEPWNIEAKSPDAFVLDQIHINLPAVAASIRQVADSRINPPEAVEDILTQLERDGLVESIVALRTS
jgi:hypothetical protein